MSRNSTGYRVNEILNFWKPRSYYDASWGSRRSRGHTLLEDVVGGFEAGLRRSMGRHKIGSHNWVNKVLAPLSRIARPGTPLGLVVPAARLAGLVVQSIMGNPRRDSALRTRDRLFQNHYDRPEAQARVEDFGGRALGGDFSRRFAVEGARAVSPSYRTGNFGGTGVGSGTSLPVAGGPGPGAGQQGSSVAVTIHAMDAKSFLDRSSDIAEALRSQLQLGHPVANEIRQSVQMS